jgi:hypothetical protein
LQALVGRLEEVLEISISQHAWCGNQQSIKVLKLAKVE